MPGVLIPEPFRRSPPNRRELLREVERLEECLRRAGGRWSDVPTEVRAELLRCANRAAHLLWRAGLR